MASDKIVKKHADFTLTHALNETANFISILNDKQLDLFIKKLNLPCSKQSIREMAQVDEEILLQYINQFNPGYVQESIEAAFNSLKSN